MTVATETAYRHLGETKGCADYIHDLVHELSMKLDALWRYDQYMVNAEVIPIEYTGSYIKTPCYDAYLAEEGFCDHVREFWRACKHQCEEDIRRLKQVIVAEIQKGCF